MRGADGPSPSPIPGAACVPAGQRSLALAVPGYLSFVGGSYPPWPWLSLADADADAGAGAGAGATGRGMPRAPPNVRYAYASTATGWFIQPAIWGSSIGRATGC